MIDTVAIINQVFELQSRLAGTGSGSAFERNFNRLFHIFEEGGYLVQDPTGEPYNESRTDCEVSVSGRIGPKLTITRTIKPIIYLRKDGQMQLLQKAIAIAENS